MEFVAIDVETANQSSASICQVGVACFREGKLVQVWGSLINPEDFFHPFNSRLHGISQRDVANSPTWIEVQPRLRAFLEASTLASHTYFDRGAIKGADGRYGLTSVAVSGWIDTCRVARKTWPHFQSHKLTSLAQVFGIEYGAHDAAEDARCAGEILVLAATATGLSLQELLQPTPVRKRPGRPRSRSRKGDAPAFANQ